jgi:hypothetical protein
LGISYTVEDNNTPTVHGIIKPRTEEYNTLVPLCDFGLAVILGVPQSYIWSSPEEHMTGSSPDVLTLHISIGTNWFITEHQKFTSHMTRKALGDGLVLRNHLLMK